MLCSIEVELGILLGVVAHIFGKERVEFIVLVGRHRTLPRGVGQRVICPYREADYRGQAAIHGPNSGITSAQIVCNIYINRVIETHLFPLP